MQMPTSHYRRFVMHTTILLQAKKVTCNQCDEYLLSMDKKIAMSMSCYLPSKATSL
ncbi:hypothetical protein MA16_Dca023302 [Dendrobium catenatum]|uniref:Uncharacterized protein n=1 Tax=Dendrobium catenatum TaxID=906689 RepID=A0A2I0WE07_9ASPA|nr:hypothetical protein MA16_Dca023302 [Dendrobium catenatum]